METTLSTPAVTCSQCGGELHPDEGQIFLTCPYCNAAVYLDRSQVVFHWYLAPTLDETQARAALARWMAGNQTVKDLDKKSLLQSVTFEYFPVWYFKRRQGDGKETLFLEPAAATSISELRRLKLPAGDLRKYESDLDGQARLPSVPLEAAREWLAGRQVPPKEISEQALVHIPLYTCKYVYQGRVYTAIVEGGTGSVLANLYPAKAEAPYLLIGGVTALVFLCLALFPLAGAATSYQNGTWIGALACTGVGIIVAPVLFAVAAWIASKV